MNEALKKDEKTGIKSRKKNHLLNDQSFEALTTTAKRNRP